MDYKKIYNNLINFRKINHPIGYSENHHIVMKSMGGIDDSENLVRLTGREHWVAHLLLHKIHNNIKTAHACHMMTMRCEERGISWIKNSRMYQHIREACAKLTATRMSIYQQGTRNSQFGTRWICNVFLKENKKITKDEKIPDNWVLGRNKWKEPKLHTKNCQFCFNEFHSKKKKQQFCSKKCSNAAYVGTTHSEEAKNKIRLSALGHTRNRGENNPMHSNFKSTRL